MTFDFRASQLRTSKIIASGSTGTNAKLLLYPIAADGSPSNQGNINSSIFDTGSIGHDVFFFVSGGIGGINGSSQVISLFGGDVYASGSIKTEQTLTAQNVSAVNVGASLSVSGLQFIGTNAPDTNFFISSLTGRFVVQSYYGGGVADIHSQGKISFGNGSAYSGTLSSSNTDNRTWNFPDVSGDVLLTSRILAGTNITVNSHSNGYVSITGSAGSASTTWIDGGAKLKTTASVAISTDGVYADAHGSDNYFYVSGSGANKAVFGGTTHFSGNVESEADFGPFKFAKLYTGGSTPTLIWSSYLSSSYTVQNIDMLLMVKKKNNLGRGRFHREFVVSRTTGSVSIDSDISVVVPDYCTTGSWTFSIVPSGSYLNVYVTGSAATDLRWQLRAQVDEIIDN
jgi:hypothetical protein